MVGRLVRDPLPITRGGTGQRTATNAFDALSPLTTLGDLLTNDGTNDVRLAIGAADTFLGSTGAAAPSWRTAAQVLASLGYEVGTFTPTMAFATVGTSTWAYTTQTGLYIKFARLVWVHVFLDATPTIGTGSGTVTVEGLPFTPDALTILTAANLDADWTWPVGRTSLAASTVSGAAQLRLQADGTGVATGTFTDANMTSGNSHLVRVTGVYRTAS